MLFFLFGTPAAPTQVPRTGYNESNVNKFSAQPKHTQTDKYIMTQLISFFPPPHRARSIPAASPALSRLAKLTSAITPTLLRPSFFPSRPAPLRCHVRLPQIPVPELKWRQSSQESQCATPLCAPPSIRRPSEAGNYVRAAAQGMVIPNDGRDSISHMRSLPLIPSRFSSRYLIPAFL